MSNESNAKFSEWRRKVNELLPEISRRLFALRGKPYTGCGFHWSHEKELGYVISKINDYDDREFYHESRSMMRQIVLQVATEGLFADVARIEKELGIPDPLLCPEMED